MKVVVRTDEYTIYQKRNERYAVKNADREWVNGAAKIGILLEHKLIDAVLPKDPEPKPVEAPAEKAEAAEAETVEAETETAAEEATEEVAEVKEAPVEKTEEVPEDKAA